MKLIGPFGVKNHIQLLYGDIHIEVKMAVVQMVCLQYLLETIKKQWNGMIKCLGQGNIKSTINNATNHLHNNNLNDILYVMVCE